MSERYHYNFAWESPYGRIVRMLERRLSPDSLILDLGCGFGAVAEPLREVGLTYVGCDIEEPGLTSLRERGFEANRLDLADVATVGERIHKIANARPVGAVLLLDSLEHLPNPEGFLAELREVCLELDRPLLGVSIPNVAHFDVGAKLVMGRWDVTPAGLLDVTHLQFFTESRVAGMLGAFGWFEIARDDFELHHSDQHFPLDDPVLADGAPLRDLLWRLRQRTGADACINQFVRLFGLASQPPASEPVPTETANPFLSVLIRTQGRRTHNLLEALTCMAAQTDDDFEILLLVHSPNDGVVQEVRALIDSFAPNFAIRVKVHAVPDGERAHPLNVGLALASGRYVGFLDDDDLVTADWVERFRDGARAAPGRMVRSITVDRRVTRVEETGARAPYLAAGPLELAHAATFDALEHLYQNRTPNCSFAVPMDAVRSLRAQFDEELSVLEDWDFLISIALICGVHDTGRITSVYHRWTGAESSLGSIKPAVWETTRLAVLQRLDAGPLLLPKGSASRIASLWRASFAAGPLNTELDQVRRSLHDREGEVERLQAQLDEARRTTIEQLRGDLREAYWRDSSSRDRELQRLQTELDSALERLAEREGQVRVAGTGALLGSGSIRRVASRLRRGVRRFGGSGRG